MMCLSKDDFVERYSRAARAGDAALFIGAGLSRPADLPDWRNLLRDVATSLGLDIDRETDLLAVAQFHVNEMQQNYALLNDLILEKFARTVQITENHAILARLPVSTIWTTNYDHLIEDAIKAAGKVPDVKLNHANLAQTRPRRDVVVYKMHGDVDQPQEAVITKDHYEKYESTHPLFTETLKGDLISKTFLFLGFSFTDPNIDYVLSRVRVLLGANQRHHYCIMRQPRRPRGRGKELAEYEYESRKLELRIKDLQRFAIQTVLIEDYAEITELLRRISQHAHQKNIIVSGSARDYGAFGEARLVNLARRIGSEIIARGYNLVSGFGQGLGEHVILGALDGLYRVEKGLESGRLIIRPFPRAPRADEQKQADRRHREDLVSQSGVAYFLCGNREYDGRIDISKGVRAEFDVVKKMERFPIPLGCTGYAAKEIWEEVFKDIDRYFPMGGVQRDFEKLADPGATDDEYINALFAITDKATKWADDRRVRISGGTTLSGRARR
jgi:Sir2- and TIR-associating SLOG family/SIR2-like domain